MIRFASSTTSSSPFPMSQASGNDMRQSGLQKRLVGARDATIVADRINAFLRHQHPYFTSKQVSAKTGISPATVSKWLERNSAPSAVHIGSLFMAYGWDFLAAAWPCPKLERAALLARQEELEARAAQGRRELDRMRP